MSEAYFESRKKVIREIKSYTPNLGFILFSATALKIQKYLLKTNSENVSTSEIQ
jgi:hypothetical protein